MTDTQRIKDSVQTSGLVSTLLAPFIHYGVVALEAKTGMALGTGYEAQVLVGVAALIQWGTAHYRQRQINQTQTPDANMLGIG